MYNGKYKKSKRLLRWNRQFVLLASIAVLLVGAVGGSLAYLTTNTPDVVNTFTPGEVPPSINETRPEKNGNIKEHVSVTNTGNVDAYIRAAVVVNWVDDQGNIVNNPEGHTYVINYSKTDWVDGKDGYFYYTKPVAEKGKTGELISSAYPTAGTTYKLQIEIMAQTIQADGVDAKGNKPIELAWNVDIENGKLIAATISAN